MEDVPLVECGFAVEADVLKVARRSIAKHLFCLEALHGGRLVDTVIMKHIKLWRIVLIMVTSA